MTKIGRHRSKKPKFGFNRNVAKLRVSKLQIVQREIDTCADLYFSFGDLVSTHLLISAAHEILAAFDKKILKTGMLFDHIEEYIKPELLEDYRILIKTPFIGFKHGSKDLDTIIELPSGITEILIISAIEKYQEITKRTTPKMLLLRMWIGIHHHLLKVELEQDVDAPTVRENFPAYAREEFRKAYCPICVEWGGSSRQGSLKRPSLVPHSLRGFFMHSTQHMFPKRLRVL